jgi:hypothetical protein
VEGSQIMTFDYSRKNRESKLGLSL